MVFEAIGKVHILNGIRDRNEGVGSCSWYNLGSQHCRIRILSTCSQSTGLSPRACCLAVLPKIHKYKSGIDRCNCGRCWEFETTWLVARKVANISEPAITRVETPARMWLALRLVFLQYQHEHVQNRAHFAIFSEQHWKAARHIRDGPQKLR